MDIKYNNEYTVPAGTTIGHVHLKVANIQRALDFYVGVLGYEIMTRYGEDAVFLSAGGYHHHIGLNTWESKNALPPAGYSTGLYHFAILYPTRKDLAVIVQRLIEKKIRFGSSDHLVSEAIYLSDPDGNGIELYRDRPKEEWKYNLDGSIMMDTVVLDIENLLGELDK